MSRLAIAASLFLIVFCSSAEAQFRRGGLFSGSSLSRSSGLRSTSSAVRSPSTSMRNSYQGSRSSSFGTRSTGLTIVGPSSVRYPSSLDYRSHSSRYQSRRPSVGLGFGGGSVYSGNRFPGSYPAYGYIDPNRLDPYRYGSFRYQDSGMNHTDTCLLYTSPSPRD